MDPIEPPFNDGNNPENLEENPEEISQSEKEEVEKTAMEKGMDKMKGKTPKCTTEYTQNFIYPPSYK